MASSLSAADLRAVLAFGEATLALDRFSDLSSVLLGGLAALVGSERATLTHLDLRTQREVVVLWPPARPTGAVLEAYRAHGAGHPLRAALVQQVRAGRPDRAPVRVSDLLSLRQWRRTSIYREVLPGVQDQMCLPLAGRGTVVHAITLGRGGRTFSARQLALLARCRGHLASAVRRVDRTGYPALQIAPATAWVSALDVPGRVGTRAARPATGATAVLTGREREVVRLVADGLTDAQVARRLELAPATVSKHLHRVYARLGVPNRVAAVQAVSRLAGSDLARPGPGTTDLR